MLIYAFSSQFSTIMDIMKDFYTINENIIVTSEEQSETIKIVRLISNLDDEYCFKQCFLSF